MPITWPLLPPSVPPAVPFLRLNGIVVPVAPGSATLAPEAIGKMRRSANGSATAGRRLRKGGWKFSTAIRTAVEALAIRELLAGEGHVLSFDNLNWYTSQGMAPVSVAVGWSFSGAPKYGTRCAQWTTGNALWAFFASGSPWTIAYWASVSGTGWHHVVVTSAGGAWLDGVDVSGGGSFPPGWFSMHEGFAGVSGGVATFGSTTASQLDDVVALPYVVPDAWPAQIYGFGFAFGLLPALTADGLFIEQNTKVSVLGGDAPTARLVASQAIRNLHDFSFELSEI